MRFLRVGLQASVVLRCMLAELRVSRLIALKEACAAQGERAQRRGLGKGEQPVRGESYDEVCNELIMCLETLTFIDFKTPPARATAGGYA